jgi:coenzyme PQQ synthesis protein D (PqqD)
LRQNPDIEAAELKGELLLLNNAVSKFFVMNSTAAFIWEKLATPTNEDELVSALSSHFTGATPDQAREDLNETLKEMREFGLILDD